MARFETESPGLAVLVCSGYQRLVLLIQLREQLCHDCLRVRESIHRSVETRCCQYFRAAAIEDSNVKRREIHYGKPDKVKVPVVEDNAQQERSKPDGRAWSRKSITRDRRFCHSAVQNNRAVGSRSF